MTSTYQIVRGLLIGVHIVTIFVMLLAILGIAILPPEEAIEKINDDEIDESEKMQLHIAAVVTCVILLVVIGSVVTYGLWKEVRAIVLPCAIIYAVSCVCDLGNMVVHGPKEHEVEELIIGVFLAIGMFYVDNNIKNKKDGEDHSADLISV